MQIPPPRRPRTQLVGTTTAPAFFVVLVVFALYVVIRQATCHAGEDHLVATVLPQRESEGPTVQGGLPHYSLSEPDLTWELPEELLEVSGIAPTGPTALVCVEDERGTLYTLDLESDGTVTQIRFGADGDYEGLARAGERLLVLRSDGPLLELNLQGEVRGELKTPLEELPYEEFECIAFEPAGKRWLVLPKDTVSDDERANDDRVIYGLGSEDFALAPEPVLVLSRKQIIKDAKARDWPLPTRVNKKGKEKSEFDFHPSDLAVHPISGDYYIVSGSDRTLIAVSPAGELVGTATFPKSLLRQPEGLAFQPNGDLLISSEGATRAAAVVVRFPFRGE